MKKILVLITLILLPAVVNANTCSTEEQVELRNIAGHVKVSYTEGERFLEDHEYHDITHPDSEVDTPPTTEIFNINLLNITEDVYVIITNNKDNEKIEVYYEDTENGEYTYIQKDLTVVRTYTIRTYASEETNCEGESYGIQYLSTPMYNVHSTEQKCVEFSEDPVCQKYTTNENLDRFAFSTRIEELEAEKEAGNNGTTNEETSLFASIINFIRDNLTIVLVSILVIGTGVATFIVIQKKRSKI